MRIRAGGLDQPAVTALIAHHLAWAAGHSPPGSVHALGAGGLGDSAVSFWSGWDGDELVAIGALRRLSDDHAEIKSMRVADARRGQGHGAAMLDHIVAEACGSGCRRLSLETGSMAAFVPARTMYERAGFKRCPPFADYWDDPLSCCYTRSL